nr:hypothetical protein CR513_38730 [Ipomoea batatas]
MITPSLISCIIFNTCHISGRCSGELIRQAKPTSRIISVRSPFSPPPPSSRTALTHSAISSGGRNGCSGGGFPVRSSSRRTPKEATKLGCLNLPTDSMCRSKSSLFVPPTFPASNLFTQTTARLSSTALYVVAIVPLPRSSADAVISCSSVYAAASPAQNTKFPLFPIFNIPSFTFLAFSSSSSSILVATVSASMLLDSGGGFRTEEEEI